MPPINIKYIMYHTQPQPKPVKKGKCFLGIFLPPKFIFNAYIFLFQVKSLPCITKLTVKS